MAQSIKTVFDLGQGRNVADPAVAEAIALQRAFGRRGGGGRGRGRPRPAPAQEAPTSNPALLAQLLGQMLGGDQGDPMAEKQLAHEYELAMLNRKGELAQEAAKEQRTFGAEQATLDRGAKLDIARERNAVNPLDREKQDIGIARQAVDEARELIDAALRDGKVTPQESAKIMAIGRRYGQKGQDAIKEELAAGLAAYEPPQPGIFSRMGSAISDLF